MSPIYDRRHHSGQLIRQPPTASSVDCRTVLWSLAREVQIDAFRCRRPVSEYCERHASTGWEALPPATLVPHRLAWREHHRYAGHSRHTPPLPTCSSSGCADFLMPRISSLARGIVSWCLSPRLGWRSDHCEPANLACHAHR